MSQLLLHEVIQRAQAERSPCKTRNHPEVVPSATFTSNPGRFSVRADTLADGGIRKSCKEVEV